MNTGMFGFARPAGGRRLAGLVCLVFGALAVTGAPASAQLPKLGDVTEAMEVPLQNGAVGDLVPGHVVEQVVDQPLPEPVEELVSESPVAPVREEVRRLTGQGGGGPGGGGGDNGGGDEGGGSGIPGSGSGAGTSGSTGGGSAGAGTDGTGSTGDRADSPRSRGDRQHRGTGARGGARRGGGAGRLGADLGENGAAGGVSAPARERARGRDSNGEPSEERGAAIRTIETIVSAVPTPLWIALGVLALLALALGGRTLVERRTARALERDREQLLRDVAMLERALLPVLPEQIGALATSVAYRPSDGPAAGGDFYDAFELPDGRAAVIVGDVSGHGPEALECTNSMRGQLRALLEDGLPPRDALATVGRRENVQLNGRFTTVVVGVHDPLTATLTYATAGHPPPIVAGPDAEEALTVGAAPPIGVGLRTGVRETTLPLRPGSLACFFTDGLVEARVGEELLGRARLTEIVASLEPDGRAEAVLERVVAGADEASDDMAVCVVRPLTGARVRSARTELVELDAEDVDAGLAERFLEACGLSDGAVAAAADRARATVEAHGCALVEVTIPGRDALDGAEDLLVDVLVPDGGPVVAG